MKNVTKHRRNFIFLSIMTRIWCLGIRLQDGSPTFEIIATKTEKTLIHILRDVVVAVALLHLKVHNKKRPKPQNNFDKFSEGLPRD